MSTSVDVIQLWDDSELGGVVDTRTEHRSTARVPFPPLLVRNVNRPRMTVHRPDAAVANGSAVIVAPGGAMHFFSIAPEGTDVADYLTARGFTAFVLEYRLIPTPDDPDAFETDMVALFSGAKNLGAIKAPYEEATIADGLRAIEIVHQRADEFGVAADRVGIVGFSAGGFVAAQAALRGSGLSRPDFVGCIYAALWESFEAPANPMPMFVAVANDDQLGEIMTGTASRLHAAWAAVRAPVQLHLYQWGGHGFGMRPSGAPSDDWIAHFYSWLSRNLASGIIGSDV